MLVEKDIASSRERAKAYILAGHVLVDGKPAKKAGEMYPPEADVTLKEPGCPYVGRGGLKLEKALREFSIDIRGKICADIGASTGGFTDCMLAAGARQVYAVDVGYGQLAWKLRTDKRVVVMERVNARYLEPEDFDDTPVFAAIDVSFISLALILPALREAGVQEIVALIKPQFEAGREKVGKKGIVREEKVHREVLQHVLSQMCEIGYWPQGLTYSPITGQKGNIEFLVYLKNTVECEAAELSEICKIVREAHENF